MNKFPPIQALLISKNNFVNILYLGTGLCAIVLLSLLASHHMLGFSFVDEYNNWVIGTYLLEGRVLYEEIYLNHQMLVAYISAAVQFLTNPESIYQVVVVHRAVVIVLSALFGLLMMFRFGHIGLLFFVIYELSKFYLFGHLLLGESIIAYLLAFNAGVLLEKIRGQKIYWIDFILVGIFTYAITFLREPYGPVAIATFALFILGKKYKKQKAYSIGLFLLLTIVTLLTIPVQEYIFQVIYVNAITVFASEAQTTNFIGSGLLKIVFYPFYVFTNGEMTYIRYIQMALSALFITVSVLLLKQKEYKLVVVMWGLLALCAVRPTIPGEEYYGAFHMLVYHSVLIFFVSYGVLCTEIKNNIRHILFAPLLTIIAFQLLYPHPYIRTQNTQQTFTDQYSNYYAIGEVIHRLSEDDEKLFVNGYDSLVYVTADTTPAYPYVFFYPEMNAVNYYTDLREDMFRENPPTFYFQDCITASFVILDEVKDAYTPMIFNNSPTCLFIRNDTVEEVRKRLERVEDLGYTI